MSNANYTRIYAHSTASAFEPGLIKPVDSPFKVLEAKVDLIGAGSGDFLPFGGEIPPDCSITAVSFNSKQTLDSGITFVFGFYDSNLEEFTGDEIPSASTLSPAEPGREPNGGQLVPGPVVVPTPSVAGGPLLPAIRIDDVPSPIVGSASVWMQVFYTCP